MDISSSRRLVVGAGLYLLAIGSSCASQVEPQQQGSVESSEEALRRLVPVIPEEIAVPEGARLSSLLFAEGVQIYDCKASAEGAASWTFRAPEADLYGLFGWPLGSHYAGPTWEAFDGSTVVGARVAGATVDAASIPWLLLKASANTGDGVFSKVAYVQRLFTHGGNAPADGCDAQHLGAVAEVDYSAIYAYYR